MSGSVVWAKDMRPGDTLVDERRLGGRVLLLIRVEKRGIGVDLTWFDLTRERIATYWYHGAEDMGLDGFDVFRAPLPLKNHQEEP